MITVQIDGRTYTWVGGFGAILESKERGCSLGQCRVIGNYLFYVYSMWSGKVAWTLFDSNNKLTCEKIKEIKESLFNV